jgi:hypothetical protein
MTETYTIKNVTEDLSFLLTLTKLFEADEEGFWFDPGTNERHKHLVESNSSPKEIVLFQDPLPKGDYYFFNPYSEGFGQSSPAVQLYFKTIRISFNLYFNTVMMHIMREVAEHKELVKEDPSHKLSNAAVRMTHLPVDNKTTLYDYIDDKVINEFEKIISRIDASGDDDLIFVPYMRQHMTAKVVCDTLTDSNWDEKFGHDIRKKSLVAFKAAVMGVLGISNPSDLSKFSTVYDPELKTAPRLWATLTTYLKLYSKFNDVIPDAFAINGVTADKEAIDLGELQAVLDRSSMAYSIAKHVVQPVPPKKNVVDTTTIDTPKITIGGGNNLTRSGSRFAPQIIDDSRNSGLNRGLSINNRYETQSRFKPQIIDTRDNDPFSPAAVGNGSVNLGHGLGGVSSERGYFGETNRGGLTLTPRSNFGSPETSRRYFG